MCLLINKFTCSMDVLASFVDDTQQHLPLKIFGPIYINLQLTLNLSYGLEIKRIIRIKRKKKFFTWQYERCK